MGTCPECDETFYIDEDTEVGDIVDCVKCGANLEVLNLHPVMIDYASAGEQTPAK